MARLEKLNVLIREKQIPIANLDLHRATEVVDEVRKRLPHYFSMSTHTLAWRYFEIRPAGGDSRPERTKPQYCVWDRVHRDYVYTDAWIERLVQEFSDPNRYQTIVGSLPLRS